jgi:diaminohydroxyphosphoribosylaminopyrimidine deaminase/5-amino-6-(5-phosphoribosylamino)uracil reductase
MTDRDYMREALALAAKGIALATPNPMVGAVVVQGDSIVGCGFHTWQGLKHAEVLALEEAGEAARGATVYQTLEPCSHIGRTGPCADALIAAGVSRIVAPSADPNPLVAGEGFRRLRAAGVRVDIATEFQAEAEKLNEPFYASDAIITGIGTALADDPRLTDRSGLPRARPLWRVVLDSTLRLPLESQLVQTAANNDLIVAATSAASPERRRALENRGVEVKVFDGPRGRVDMRDVVALLSERRCLSVLIEAGSKVNWAALESGVVDKVFLYYAPKILGGLQSLPMAGGTGRMRRADAILLERTTLHPIPPDEFAVEAYVRKDV